MYNKTFKQNQGKISSSYLPLIFKGMTNPVCLSSSLESNNSWNTSAKYCYKYLNLCACVLLCVWVSCFMWTADENTGYKIIKIAAVIKSIAMWAWHRNCSSKRRAQNYGCQQNVQYINSMRYNKIVLLQQLSYNNILKSLIL